MRTELKYELLVYEPKGTINVRDYYRYLVIQDSTSFVFDFDKDEYVNKNLFEGNDLNEIRENYYFLGEYNTNIKFCTVGEDEFFNIIYPELTHNHPEYVI